MPMEITHNIEDERLEPELYELEREGYVHFAPETSNERTFSEVYKDVRNAKFGKQARMQNPVYVQKLTECANFLVMAKNGRVSDHQFREVLSTSDFPILFGDILDLRLLNQYNTTQNVWSMYASRGTVPDFRQSRIVALDGLQKPLVPINEKPELTGVQYDNNIDETGYLTSVKVYERGFAFNWRMLINSRGNFLSRVPMLLGRAAARTEERFTVGLYMSASGPDATFFSNTNKNLVNTTNGAASNNPPLSIQGLKDALNVMYAHVDSDGQPIMTEGVVLVVSPLKRLDALEILKATQLEIVPSTSAAHTRFTTPPWVNDFKLAVSWYQRILDATANKDTTWYLFAEPNINRPAMEVTFLAGYETPSLWQKAPNTQRMGGGIDAMMGDFNDMSIHYKMIHVIGGTLLDPFAAVVSNGSGT